MPTKRLYVLANSFKHGHCVAGREILDHESGLYFGEWIRPISGHGEGELNAVECSYAGGGLVDIFDVVDITLKKPVGSVAQPENWLIDPTKRWQKVDDFDYDEIPELVPDTPPNLWLPSYGRDDRISPTALAGLNRNRSLYLLQVRNFKLKFEWRGYSGDHKRRATFDYRGRNYNLSITDPRMGQYFGQTPPTGQERLIPLPSGSKQIICVSLTEPFQGNHYKVIATVLGQNA